MNSLQARVVLIVCLCLFASVASSEESRLLSLVEEYYEARLRLYPILATYNGDHRFNDKLSIAISPSHRNRALALEQDFLKRAAAIDTTSLDAGEPLTLELFVHGRKTAIELHNVPDHLMPVDQFQSYPVLFAMLGAGGSIQPFDTVKDYENWLARLAVWPRWVDQAIENMRQGVEAGIVQPRILMERALPLLDAHVTKNPRDSAFFRPIENMPATIGSEDRKRLEQLYVEAIRKNVVVPYRRLRDFIRDDYMPHARKSVGLSALPDSGSWYALAVRMHTTTDMTPKEIHALGVAEVARIEKEVAAAYDRKWPAGSTTGYSGNGRLLDGYRGLRKRVAARLPSLFEQIPEADFEIRPVDAFRRSTAAGGSYVAGTPDGTRLGIFYVNASEDAGGEPSEALFLHEAIPGHHFQISLQRQVGELPRFRRFAQYTAYSEGWALYVESLGGQLGLYRTRSQQVGALRSELFRARRLVVDTGLHAMGWSRQRAIDYLGSTNEIDRYIAMPGQALAYKVGQLRILEMRRNAERRLGERFDIRRFHQVVLGAGAMPLDVLEARVEGWIEARSAP